MFKSGHASKGTTGHRHSEPGFSDGVENLISKEFPTAKTSAGRSVDKGWSAGRHLLWLRPKINWS